MVGWREIDEVSVPKNRPDIVANGRFGERLVMLRKEAGYTQQELANELGISRRMVAYYERQTDHPPAYLLVTLAKLLNVTADELLGIKSSKNRRPQKDARLWRRFNKIEKLPPKERRHLMHVIDKFLIS